MMGSAQPPGWSPRAAYLALAALFAMNLLNYIDRFILAAVLEPVGTDLQLDEVQQGFLSTIFLVVYSAFSPVMGWLGDRWPRKYLLAAGVGVWSVATFGTGLAGSYGHLILARSVLGIGEATYATLAPALISDLFPRDRRNRALTIFYVAIPLGAALGYGLGGLLHDLVGWRKAFGFVGLPGLAVALSALAIREPRRGATEEAGDHTAALPLSWKVYARLARNRSFVYNTLGAAMSAFALGGLQWWTPKFFETSRGMTNAGANSGLGVSVLIGGLVGTPLGGLLADRLLARVRGAYFWLSGVTTLFSIPFIVVALAALWPWLIWPAIVAGMVLALMNYGPSNAITANVTPPNIRAAAYAVNLFFIHWLGDIPSPLLIGAVASIPGSSLFLGLGLTIPALALSGLFFCLGASHLEADQEAVLQQLRGVPPAEDSVAEAARSLESRL
jgi:MFS family permease